MQSANHQNHKTYLLLFLVGLMVNLGIALFQPSPGYMDADYYYAGGLQLASGHGFSEPYLWHYLDDPTGLPHSSHTYWMPLASILAAAALALAPALGFAAARVGFILAAACVPPLTAALAWSLTCKPNLAVAAGVLAIFSGFYAAFLPTTDTFGLYMLGGGFFLLLVHQFHATQSPWLAAPLGLIAGLMHLARADGLLWLGVLLLACVIFFRADAHRLFLAFGLALAAYLVVMLPWYVRNLTEFGTLMAPGGSRALWLTAYDRLFAYPASQVSFNTWLAAGLPAALHARAWALQINLQTIVAVQGGIILFPFILVALWRLRCEISVRLGVLAWGLTFFAMTFIFPFAGARGGFFHSGAALQPLWWALVPLGLSIVTDWAVERVPTWRQERAQPGFRVLLLGLAAFLTVTLVTTRIIIPSWDASPQIYADVEAQLQSAGAPLGVPVIVSNPPGYYLSSGRPAIALPDGNLDTLLTLRRQFGARYVIMDAISTPKELLDLFHAAQSVNGLRYLGEVHGTRIFEIP